MNHYPSPRLSSREDKYSVARQHIPVSILMLLTRLPGSSCLGGIPKGGALTWGLDMMMYQMNH